MVYIFKVATFTHHLVVKLLLLLVELLLLGPQLVLQLPLTILQLLLLAADLGLATGHLVTQMLLIKIRFSGTNTGIRKLSSKLKYSLTERTYGYAKKK